MQDRYAGDVGDFVTLGLLRAISFDRRLGLVWYRLPDEAHNNDGRHINYLQQRHLYGQLDQGLFDHLGMVAVGARTINSLLPMLPGSVSVGECVDVVNVTAPQRSAWRQSWFSRTLDHLSDCDIVFADPDSGIVDNEDHRRRRAKFGKQIPLDEVHSLARRRCAVIYHHNTRRVGGHDSEVDHWLRQFDMPAIAIRATAYSPRTFFVINPGLEMRNRMREFCSRWKVMQVRLHDTMSSSLA